MSGYTALYDACVLYPAPLRDLLMQLAVADLFRAKWTAMIHDEWVRNVLANRPDLTAAQLQRTRELMDSSVRDALVFDFEDLIPSIQLPDPDDRHVVAAAIRGRCDVIVTYNLDDFPVEVLAKYDIEAQHPDEFLSHLTNLRPDVVCMAARTCRLRLKNPKLEAEGYLESMARQRLPELVKFLASHHQLI